MVDVGGGVDGGGGAPQAATVALPRASMTVCGGGGDAGGGGAMPAVNAGCSGDAEPTRWLIAKAACLAIRSAWIRLSVSLKANRTTRADGDIGKYLLWKASMAMVASSVVSIRTNAAAECWARCFSFFTLRMGPMAPKSSVTNSSVSTLGKPSTKRLSQASTASVVPASLTLMGVAMPSGTWPFCSSTTRCAARSSSMVTKAARSIIDGGRSRHSTTSPYRDKISLTESSVASVYNPATNNLFATADSATSAWTPSAAASSTAGSAAERSSLTRRESTSAAIVRKASPASVIEEGSPPDASSRRNLSIRPWRMTEGKKVNHSTVGRSRFHSPAKLTKSTEGSGASSVKSMLASSPVNDQRMPLFSSMSSVPWKTTEAV
mmetsp:Transcript_44684/g.129138  ORF Transcript_44684/g.129138 Transcript_44684/m.129138 type:complete len:378 (+) Transcript_44684:183-1316(+)